MNPRDINIRETPVDSSTPTFESRRYRRGRFHTELRIRDARARGPIAAAAYLGPTGYRTYGSPHRFLGRDGIIYRVKDRAQEGHGAEAIANRIASLLGVGPACEILDIGRASLPADGRVDYLLGLRAGAAEIDDALNDDELRAIGLRLPANKINWDSWAKVIGFQTWIYAGDPQAVIRASDGRVFSVDHGACFRDLAPGPTTGLIVPSLFGVSGSTLDIEHILVALDCIEGVTEEDLLATVAGIPGDDPGWRMPIERRVRLVDWLLARQSGVRKVMEWKLRLS